MKRKHPPAKMKDLTPAERRRYKKILAEEMKRIEPLLEACRTCERLTGKDYSIVINARS